MQAPAAGFAVAAVAVAFALGLGIGLGLAPASRSEPALTPPAPVIRVSAPVRAAHAAEVLRVLDGDTFEARVHLWPGLDVTTRVRLRGIDAPEMKARCFDERRKAEAARDALKAMLGRGGVGVMRVTLDKYGGRVLADASTHAVADVAEALLSAGHARRYGARRETWCPF